MKSGKAVSGIRDHLMKSIDDDFLHWSFQHLRGVSSRSEKDTNIPCVDGICMIVDIESKPDRRLDSCIVERLSRCEALMQPLHVHLLIKVPSHSLHLSTVRAPTQCDEGTLKDILVLPAVQKPGHGSICWH